ncbi:MAG: EamA/RhaT family transporter [Thaumarchaeota archaeon]|nr:MAG: EamA/RhaT family transporter [Nitrososphaerota archaeon]
MDPGDDDRRPVYRGLAALLLTTLLWGSSFPAIKFVVDEISEFTYVWFRSLVALAGLTPYTLYMVFKRRLDREVVVGGFLAGIAYAVGLWLQGWGTKYTTASNSAFITGLNVVFVHLYSMLLVRRYSGRLAASLISAVTGLYLLTKPVSGFGFGEGLVLAGAFFWALQIILIDRYCEGDPLLFTYFEMMPALLFMAPSLHNGIVEIPHGMRLIALIYLGLVCSDIAFALQVYGQKFIEAAAAGIIFLFEPVFAAFMAWLSLGETLKPLQIIGASLILLALFLSSKDTMKEIN